MYDIITEINDLSDLKRNVSDQETRILKALTTMLDKKGYPSANINGYKLDKDEDYVHMRFSVGNEMRNQSYSVEDVDDFIRNLNI